MLYLPPSGSTDPNAHFVGKNTGAGTQGSKVPAGAIENPQREIQAAIIDSGQGPTNDDLGQLSKAIDTKAKRVAAAAISDLSIPAGVPIVFAAPGVFTLTLAADCDVIEVADCIGAGGGGGSASGTSTAGSGAGGGARARGVYKGLKGKTLVVVVGQPGVSGLAGANPTRGTDGGTSSITVQGGAALCAATGGTAGYPSASGSPPTLAGVGGVASGGQINDAGDNGGLPIAAAGNLYQGGSGGPSPGAPPPQPNVGNPGNTSSSPGVGGNGSSANALGGTGSPGRVIIRAKVAA